MLIIERPRLPATQSGSGETVDLWDYVIEMPGSIEQQKGAEGIMASQIIATADTKICLRWSPIIAEFNATWRLRFGVVIYNLVSVDNVGMRNREFEIMATSGANQG